MCRPDFHRASLTCPQIRRARCIGAGVLLPQGYPKGFPSRLLPARGRRCKKRGANRSAHPENGTSCDKYLQANARAMHRRGFIPRCAVMLREWRSRRERNVAVSIDPTAGVNAAASASAPLVSATVGRAHAGPAITHLLIVHARIVTVVADEHLRRQRPTVFSTE